MNQREKDLDDIQNAIKKGMEEALRKQQQQNEAKKRSEANMAIARASGEAAAQRFIENLNFKMQNTQRKREYYWDALDKAKQGNKSGAFMSLTSFLAIRASNTDNHNIEFNDNFSLREFDITENKKDLEQITGSGAFNWEETDKFIEEKRNQLLEEERILTEERQIKAEEERINKENWEKKQIEEEQRRKLIKDRFNSGLCEKCGGKLKVKFLKYRDSLDETLRHPQCVKCGDTTWVHFPNYSNYWKHYIKKIKTIWKIAVIIVAVAGALLLKDLFVLIPFAVMFFLGGFNKFISITALIIQLIITIFIVYNVFYSLNNYANSDTEIIGFGLSITGSIILTFACLLAYKQSLFK